jgi:hypothetical protein
VQEQPVSHPSKGIKLDLTLVESYAHNSGQYYFALLSQVHAISCQQYMYRYAMPVLWTANFIGTSTF